MNKYLGGLVLVMLMTGFSSCSLYRSVTGKKKKGSNDTVRVVTDTPKVVTVYNHDSLRVPHDSAFVAAAIEKYNEQARAFWTKRLQYKTFSGKAKMHFESPDEKQEFTAHFRVQKDSIIWIAITALGGMVPVARIYVTPDTLVFVNQRENEYSRMSLAEASNLLPTPVDFTTLQNLIVGEPLRDGKVVDVNDKEGARIVAVEDDSYRQDVTYNMADTTVRTAEMKTKRAGGPQAKIDFSNYETHSNGKLSTNRTVNIHNNGKDFSLDMNFMKTDFDQLLDFPVTIPRNYKEKQLQVKPK